jgi:hypothetical protein
MRETNVICVIGVTDWEHFLLLRVDSNTASAFRDEGELTVAAKEPFRYSPAQ